MKGKRKSVFVSVGMLVLFVISIILLLSSNNKEIKNYQNALNSDKILKVYFADEATIEKQGSATWEKHSLVSYTVSANVNDKFAELSDEQKYDLFLKVIDVLEQEDNSYSSIDCGRNKTCSINGFQFIYLKDVYVYKKVLVNDYYSLVVNGEEVYDRKPKKNNVVPKINLETETTIDEMDGNEWLLLNDNEKFHAVSNALYNLDQQGYTILEGEYYYIDALDAFYSGGSTNSELVRKILAQVGIVSGTIYQ